MKLLITLFTILTFSSAAFATITPSVLVSNEVLEVMIDENLEIFNTANFNSEEETLVFTTKQDMAIVQIFDTDGEMAFQLPVMSDYVTINKNIFDTGKYKLGFVLQGSSEVHFANVTIK